MALLLLTTRAGAVEQIWQEVNQARARAAETPARQYQVDSLALRAMLQRVTEISGPGTHRIIRLPMPDGSLADFEIYESPVMQAALAQRFPEIKTYKVYGIDDPLSSGRLDMTPQGFHAMLHTSQGRVFIDPQAGSQWLDRYQARSRSTSLSPGYTCGVDGHALSMTPVSQSAVHAAERIRGSILEYRLAVAATEEYVESVYDDSLLSESAVEQAQAAIVTAINRINVIYERDLGIRLVLVANNDQLIESGDNVVFSNGNGSRMFLENQAWIDSRIGRSNYDIGHVFGTGGGGLVFRGSACDRINKAKGVSGIFNPLGDPFYIDFVSHEMGHQLNAEHSFNGSTMSCGPGRIQTSAVEPGSGSTIMAYAGICGVENLQPNSDATFHALSIAQIDSFTAAGGSCYTRREADPVNPKYPFVAALANRVIPANTAFVLDGSASDADAGQTLSYQWDQMDAGCPTNAKSYGTDTGYNALFRSYLPRNVPKRHFPALGTQLQGLYDDAEVVPCNTRDVNLRLTVRDDLSGVGSANVRVSVQNTGATFEILNLATPQTIVDGAVFDVTWRVAGTDQPPISCANVDIDLLTFADGYASYSVYPLLMTPTLNNGSASVSIPKEKSHPRARIRVKCSNNVFYDISSVDLVIDGTDPDPLTGNFSDTETPVFFNNSGSTGPVAPACGAVVHCNNTADSSFDSGWGDSGRSSGAVDYQWLLLLTGIFLLSCIRRRGG
ncbi:MAG: hypothetical protein GY785_19175 [Gammaproteobacteria bacterium]|nr:hypothetical protein [Gammaproteobacteria bacterium]